MSGAVSRMLVAAATIAAQGGVITNPKPAVQKASPLPRKYRADKRNAMFGRKPKGNTRPLERRCIWSMQGRSGQ